MEELIKIVTANVIEYIQFLSWYYIAIFIAISYGLKKNMPFLKVVKYETKILSSENDVLNVWLIGLYIGLVFILLDSSLEFHIKGIKDFLASMIHSFFLAAVYSSFWFKIIDKYKKNILEKEIK